MTRPRYTGVLSIAISTLVLMATVISGLAPAAAQDNATSQQVVNPVSVLSRVTIVVKDADVAKRFYTYALGYEVCADTVIDREIVKIQISVEMDQTIRFVILQSSHKILGNGAKVRGSA